jgi:hypothetical protein
MLKGEKQFSLLEGTFLISEKEIKPLRFFSKKHSRKTYRLSKAHQALWADLMKFCYLLFQSNTVLDYVYTLRKIKEEAGPLEALLGKDMRSSYHFLASIDELREFYAINKEAQSVGRQDQRYQLFLDLRSKALSVLTYLTRRTKPMRKVSLDKYRERIFFMDDD